MSPVANPKKSSRQYLDIFIYGSLIVLLVCLVVTAFIFSANYLSKEKTRSEISRQQLIHFFDFQYRPMTEEMWTQNYEAISLRVRSIAQQLGNAEHTTVLANESSECLYASNPESDCNLSPEFKAAISGFKIDSKPILRFNESTNRYVYMAPLSVGAVLKGYLYAEISDPYEFYRGGNVALAIKTVAVPISCVILTWFVWLLFSHRLILRPYLSSLVEMEKERALGVLAAQVAHDIRSPLVALKSAIEGFKNLSDSERRIITAAGGRIESIANALIAKFTDVKDDREQSSFLYSVIESIVSEKQAMLGEKSRIEIVTELKQEAKNIHVPISSTELGRILSNLINNSIDAMNETKFGAIRVSLGSNFGQATLRIEDNGKGIDPETLHKLRTIGGTYGKNGGAGIGLRHAKATLSKVGGSLLIDSVVGGKTLVDMEIPIVPPPRWVAGHIDLTKFREVVVLDDDFSMHLLWKNRLGSMKTSYFSDPSQFSIESFDREQTLFIFDHEIGSSSVTGMDLIKAHGLGRSAVLVTSHFENPVLQKSIEASGARMLPKVMASTVEIFSSMHIEKDGNPDLVLIDDDRFMHGLWQFEAQQNGKAIKTVVALEELGLASLPSDTPIYVDKNLGETSGFEVAEILYRTGFTNIRISSGENIDPSKVPHFIKEVRGKDFPSGISVRV